MRRGGRESVTIRATGALMHSVAHEPPVRADDLLAQAGWVHRLARALVRDPELAHDVAQDTLLAAMERPPGREVFDLRGWLQTVARRFAGRAVRGQRERAVREARAARPEACEREQRNA